MLKVLLYDHKGLPYLGDFEAEDTGYKRTRIGFMRDQDEDESDGFMDLNARPESFPQSGEEEEGVWIHEEPEAPEEYCTCF